MGLLFPIYLSGLLLITIPIIIHLFFRLRKEPYYFSSIRFLKISFQRRNKSLKLYNLLLLLLRILFIIFLFLLLSRPYVRVKKTSGSEAHSGIVNIYVFDTSFSMNAVFNGKKLYEHSKESALKTIIPAERNYIVDTGANESRWLSSDNAEIKRDIISIKAGYSTLKSRNITASLTKVLEDTDASEFQVRILSDFQKNNSDEMNKILKVFEKNRRVSKIKLIKLTGSIPTLPNVFIENAKIKGEDVRPIFRDREYELDILINNRCEKDFRSLPISIDINGKSSTLKIDLPKFSTRLFTKKIRFDLEGYYKIAVKVMIPEKFQHFNRIQEDDVFRKVLSVKPKIYALLVTGSDYEAAYRQESFYLNLALNPYTSNSIGGNTGDIITARTYFRRFSGLDLKNFDIIYFLNVPFFTLDEQKKIVEYLKSGKCIVMIPGEKSDKDNYNKLPFMPGKITRMILDPGTEGVKFNIHINDIKNRLFRLFPQDRIKTYFSELFYYRCIKFAIDFDKQAATETIMNFESSLPFMIDYSPAEYNRGRVVVFTSQMLLDWSPNFPVSNTFAPFFHYFTVLYSNRLDDEICKRKINMKYSSDFHNNKSNEKTIVNLVYPDKTKKELPIKVAKNGISYFETDKLSIPGFYSIIKIEDKTIETSYFSTNPDYVIESITDYSEPSIKKLDRKTKFMPTTGSEVEMKNKDLTQIFIFILALIFIFEFFLTANSYRNA